MADLKSTFVNLTNTVAKSSGDFMKTAKLNIELANTEENLKSLYIETGKKVHEIYNFGGSLGQPFDDLFKDIIVCEAKIKDLQERIDTVKGVRTCERCGKSVDRRSEFCPHCGNSMFHRMEEAAPPPVLPSVESAVIEDNTPMPPHEENSATAAKKCSACGTENSTEARFCLGCGRVLGG
ncbi:zinc ribbon domain-containing protein [Tyzzerella sp. OttesenSCG-928-J15]|nr:zinc ribbon domain-containing protein [Tyzzerella sp. OttesenSCG-928-J15]